MISGKTLETTTAEIYPRKIQAPFADRKNDPNLFHQLGGYVTLEETIDLFYEKIITDAKVSYFFGSNEPKLQRARMKSFLAKSLGVAALYGNFEMDAVQSPFIKNGMALDHFVIIINHLRQAFLDLGINANLVDEAMVCIISSRK